MDLLDTLRSTGAARDFTDEPVPDDVVHRLLDTARFAPSGGNRQAWRVIVLRDAELRRQLRDIYLVHWYEYLAQSAAGMVAWSSLNDRAAEAAAIAKAPEIAAEAATGPGGFAEHFDEVPLLIVLLANLGNLATVDRDLDRYTLVGGASIYPFAWSLLLAARAEGLGGVLTTMPIRNEPAIKALLDIPDDFAVAGVLALGHPVHQNRKLTRQPVEEFATTDRFSGPPLQPS